MGKLQNLGVAFAVALLVVLMVVLASAATGLVDRLHVNAAYLRVAARGLPANGPSIFVQIAQACDRAGDPDGAWHHYELAKVAGRAAGPQNLMPEDRQLYFGTVKMLGVSELRDAISYSEGLLNDLSMVGCQRHRDYGEMNTPAAADVVPDLVDALKDSSRSASSGVARQRLRSALVTVQIGLALVLLIGAGLMLNSFIRLQNSGLGLDPQKLLTFEFRFPPLEIMK